MDNVAKIAAVLSEAQKRLLLNAFYTNSWRTEHQSPALFEKGLMATKHGFKITPLGLSVRTYLMETNNG